MKELEFMLNENGELMLGWKWEKEYKKRYFIFEDINTGVLGFYMNKCDNKGLALQDVDRMLEELNNGNISETWVFVDEVTKEYIDEHEEIIYEF